MKLLVTGCNGLVGSECVAYFDRMGWEVYGVDNNLRRQFFGDDGDNSWNLERLLGSTKSFTHWNVDIRDRERIFDYFDRFRFAAIVHAAAQPSHDLAAQRPLEDFEINAVGTFNLLEATRRFSPEAVFCFMSTNKVYGNAPNEKIFDELATRYEYQRSEDWYGIDESCRIDQTLHSIFGASKVAADVMVQEYGRYFGIKTACFRAGCITGPAQAATELHGFLSYLVKCTLTGRKYRVYGYKGKQVRDNIHSKDICRALHEFIIHPQSGHVYNIGGGRSNSISVLEAITQIQEVAGRKLEWEYVDQPRRGDHLCYISDSRRFRANYPSWSLTLGLDSILTELVDFAAYRASLL